MLVLRILRMWLFSKYSVYIETFPSVDWRAKFSCKWPKNISGKNFRFDICLSQIIFVCDHTCIFAVILQLLLLLKQGILYPSAAADLRIRIVTLLSVRDFLRNQCGLRVIDGRVSGRKKGFKNKITKTIFFSAPGNVIIKVINSWRMRYTWHVPRAGKQKMRTQFWLEGLMDRMNLEDLGVDEARTFKDVLLGTGR